MLDTPCKERLGTIGEDLYATEAAVEEFALQSIANSAGLRFAQLSDMGAREGVANTALEARGETVIRQEESVIRLRLEAEHEVRVGRLATELDRVRGELEARSSELRDARANDAKTFDALNRVREELLGRLKSETQKLLGTIDCVCDAMDSASKSLHRDGVAATPRISQSVPSRRERTLVVDTKQSRGHGAVGTPEPGTPTSSQSRHRAVASSSVAQQNAQRRLHLSAQSDRLRKPIASQKGLVGYANIYQH